MKPENIESFTISFFPEKQAKRYTSKIEFVPELIFEVVLVWLLNIVGKIAEKGKGRNACGQLCNVFYFYRVTSYYRWVIGFYRL